MRVSGDRIVDVGGETLPSDDLWSWVVSGS